MGSDRVLEGAECGKNLIVRDVQVIELNVDPDGALVTLETAVWYVCFVPGLDKEWWHRFVNQRHKHVFAMRPAGPGMWTLFEPWWRRLLTATITPVQAKKFLWGARGDVPMVRESIPGRSSQIRGWMDCAGLLSYLLGRPYWVWSPHGLYKLLLRGPHVCRMDVSALLEFAAAKLAAGAPHIAVCGKCAPGAPQTPAWPNRSA